MSAQILGPNKKNYNLAASLIKREKIGVIPTDTIYGLVGLALKPKVVKKIYKVRKRNIKKPFIVRISRLQDLTKFGIRLTASLRNILKKVWPGKVSVVLPCDLKKFSFLHRNTHSLAFRLPKNSKLLSLLRLTGPLVAPSVNFEGQKPATTVKRAADYFGNKIAFYLGGGELSSKASTLVKLKGQK